MAPLNYWRVIYNFIYLGWDAYRDWHVLLSVANQWLPVSQLDRNDGAQGEEDYGTESTRERDIKIRILGSFIVIVVLKACTVKAEEKHFMCVVFI